MALPSPLCPRTPPSKSRQRRRRPQAVALAAFSVVASLPSTAASPLPFLDFLYPSLRRSSSSSSSSQSSSSSSAVRSRSKPIQQAAVALPGPPKSPRSQHQPRDVPSSSPGDLIKRKTAKGQKVPAKFESADEGWVLADSWDLHGRSRRSDISSLPTLDDNTTAVPLPLDTSVITDPYGGSIIASPSDPLDLPQGWDLGNGRHETYSAALVAVFAAILVLCILATIGLCRWRARKLRKLRDLEQMERKLRREDSEDEASTIDEKDSKKRPRGYGTTSALRKFNKRIARIRRRRRAKSGTGDASDPEKDALENESARVTSGTSTPRHRANDIPTEDQSSPPCPALPQDIPASAGSDPTSEAIPDDVRNETAPPTPHLDAGLPRLDPAQSGDQEPAAIPGSSPLPPAYPISSEASAVHGIPEKGPIPGLEAEYDDRDLAVLSSATPAMVRPSTSAADRALEPPSPTVPSAAEVVPSFEESAQTAAMYSRTAAGATRSAHVATDDKDVLEGMRRLADAPDHQDAGTSASPLDQPRAPTWNVVDSWLAEHQVQGTLEESTSSTVNRSTDAETASGNSSNVPSRYASNSSAPRLPALPPALSMASYGPENDVAYGLGPVWRQMHPGGPSFSSPSVPATLVPSAPPMRDSIPDINISAQASAPPAWDEADDEAGPPGESIPADLPASNVDVHADQANEDAGDSAETNSSSGSDADDNRWSTSLRTRTVEGVGLPRYEP